MVFLNTYYLAERLKANLGNQKQQTWLFYSPFIYIFSALHLSPEVKTFSL